MLEFNEERHEYKASGLVVPSVTGILKAEGFIPPYETADGQHTKRGRNLHLTMQYDDERRLDEASLCEEYRAYLARYREFKTLTGVKILACEQVVYSEDLGFAGTLDREVKFRGRYGIWDYKFPSAMRKERWHILQTAAYAIGKGRPDALLGTLYFYSQNELPKLVLHDDKEAIPDFTALALAHNVKRKYRAQKMSYDYMEEYL